MDKYLLPLKPSPEAPKAIRRHRWKRMAVELDGRFEPKYRHEMSGLLTQSYSEIGAFSHLYHVDGVPCRTHMNLINDGAGINSQGPIRKQGISSLEFDNKGIYLVSVTKSGCLTVHDFEALYCHSNELSPSLEEDETKHLMHLSLSQQLDVVRWNSTNQDEVACTSRKRNEVLIFNIGYVSSEPVEVLKTRHTLTVHGSDIHKGLSDIAFTSIDDSRLVKEGNLEEKTWLVARLVREQTYVKFVEYRLLGSDTYGTISVWDRRMSTLPCLELTTNSHSALNSIELNVENQVIFGAGKHGIIYAWDLRGGRGSAAFQSHKETCHPPLTSLKLASMLYKIEPLKAQSHINSKEIHSIDLDPSCPYQLAFHLDDGWSGVLDINKFQVTHVHCPPPAWLNDSNDSSDLLSLRKPSWIPSYSIYVVGSSSEKGIHLLDFYPNPSSPCHVDQNENIVSFSGVNRQNKQNRFITLSEGVTACAAHPLNGTIVAGTKNSSLLMISQRHQSV